MADDRTKISELPVAQSIADTDVMVAVVDDATCKAYVPLLREAFVGAEAAAREAADTALGNRIDGKQDTLTFDDIPTENSNNPVKSNGIYDALATKANTADLATVATSGSYNDLADTPTIDSEMSDSSENAVQNKVVKAAIDAKADVVANPSGTATAELDKLGVNDVVYSLAGEKVYGKSSGDIATFDDGGDKKPLKSLKVAINPVQDLHGYDSPWAGGAGKNKCNAQNPIVLSQAGNIGDQPCVIPSGTYTYSWTSTSNVAISLTLWKNGVQIGQFVSMNSIQGRSSITFTITDDADTLKCYYNAPTTVSDIMVESGSSMTSYSPYSNICPISGWDEAEIHRADGATPHIIDDTYNITWSEAGEVYGGTLDVTSGVLRVDRAGVIYDGTENWHAEFTYNFYAPSGREPSSKAYYGTNKLLCSHIPSRLNSSSNPNNCFISISGNFNIQFDSSVVEHTANAFKAWLVQQYNNGTPLTISYELATPQEIQLTPTEVKTLLGNNNIRSDTGEILECVYQRDLNIVINQLIDRVATIERTGSTMPVVPTSDGTYDLKATVTSGSGNVAWVAEEPSPEPEE